MSDSDSFSDLVLELAEEFIERCRCPIAGLHLPRSFSDVFAGGVLSEVLIPAGLAAAIRKHDPRFQSVAIVPLDNTDPQDRTLRFRIEATLRVETGPETAVFSFQMEPVSRRFA